MWQVIGASAIGTSHVKSSTPCQDAHAFRVHENGCVIAAVADGLGSAPRADEGATLAVNAALDSLTEKLNAGVPSETQAWLRAMLDAFTGVREQLEELARKTGAPLREFATTLLVAVANREWLAVGHIGDGAVVAKFDGGAIETISAPVRGEYANETNPITSPEWLEYAFCTASPVKTQALALFSDGLQNQALVYPEATPFKPFFAPFFSAVGKQIDASDVSRQLETFLNSERVCAKTDDDKTLVVAGWLADATAE